jgi:hypothetical protein
VEVFQPWVILAGKNDTCLGLKVGVGPLEEGEESPVPASSQILRRTQERDGAEEESLWV